MTDAWNGIPPTGADVTGWHWLAWKDTPNEAVAMRWSLEEFAYCPPEWTWERDSEFSNYTPSGAARKFHYIAPCPVPEGYEP